MPVRSLCCPTSPTNQRFKTPIRFGWAFFLYIRKPLAGRVVQKKPNGDGVDKKTPFALNWRCGPPTAQRKAKGSHPVNDVNSLSHTSWNCKYHIVLVPKYRRKTIYGKLRKEIGKILRMLCDYKHVEIIEAHAMPDHIHMLLSIPPKLAVADFMGYLKGKSALMMFDKHANLKYKFGNRHFWSEGYYVSTV